MTQLSPEENQGGGDSGPGGDSLDSEDELDSTLVQNSASLSLEVDDLSPPLPSSSLPVPSLKPVLDDKQILSSVEKGKQSPSRLSLDVECESITSDYSELGGPLQEIERDLHYIDRDALRTEDALPPIDGGIQNVRSKDLSKGEEETEAEREWRLRKINFLSLAQEFAELKKVDSQACPINFHRNQSAKTFPRTCSPFGSRGHSLERKRNRTHSKSPMRFPEKSASRDYPKNIGNMNDASGGSTVSHPSLPKNIERKLLGKEACVPPAEDLPVNEARRRNSNTDLPANMRTDRCGNSPGISQKTRTTNPGAQDELGNVVAAEGCGDCEGDFEVYNIETAVMTQMNWHVLEEQLQAVSRLEACRNDREEIRRRLAMSTDEECVERADSEEHDLDAAFGPRKRLQDRLQAAASGMQICFMNEDDDVDDGVDEENSDGQKDLAVVKGQGAGPNQTEPGVPPPNHPCFPGEIEMFTSKQTKLQSEATLALAQASTMAHMQLEVDKQMRKKSPIADMVGIPTLGSGRRLHLKRTKLQEMNIAQLQVLVNDLHSQIELLNEDLVHLLIERDDLHMEQDSMLVDIEDLTSHCHDPTATNNNKTNINNNRTVSRRDRHT